MIYSKKINMKNSVVDELIFVDKDKFLDIIEYARSNIFYPRQNNTLPNICAYGDGICTYTPPNSIELTKKYNAEIEIVKKYELFLSNLNDILTSHPFPSNIGKNIYCKDVIHGDINGLVEDQFLEDGILYFTIKKFNPISIFNIAAKECNFYAKIV